MKAFRTGGLAFSFALSFAVAGSAAPAQDVVGSASAVVAGTDAAAPESWGTTTNSVLVLNAFAFDQFDGAAVPNADGTAARFMVSGNTCFEASVNLPTGSIIDHTELEACDTAAAADVSTAIFFCANGACNAGYTATTTGAAGCARVASPVGSTVVQNNTNTYFAQVCTGTVGATARFRALRVFYRLQVSPAPATATFPNDVPTTHPFFRFVEAMAASGLTGGCGTGSFCPDQPVTRGQLAVFLSSALGLHFPN